MTSDVTTPALSPVHYFPVASSVDKGQDAPCPPPPLAAKLGIMTRVTICYGGPAQSIVNLILMT